MVEKEKCMVEVIKMLSEDCTINEIAALTGISARVVNYIQNNPKHNIENPLREFPSYRKTPVNKTPEGCLDYCKEGRMF